MAVFEVAAMASKKFREYDLDQQFLVPPDIRDWVPEKDFARFIDDLVRSLDLSKFEEFYKPGTGQPPYDPAMMVKVILYCFCSGIFSSRKMERATYKDVGARFLAANQHPDYSSFCLFRNRHLDAIDHLFIQVVCFCKLLGLVKLGQIAIDGTIMKGNASKSKNVLGKDIDGIIDTAEALRTELMEKWRTADDDSEQLDDDLPKDLKEATTRVESLKKARAAAHEQAEFAYQKKQADFDAANADKKVKQKEAQATDSYEHENGVDLLAARKQLGITQLKLQELTGIDQPRLSRLELGKAYPTDKEKAALCEALGVDTIAYRRPNPVGRPLSPPSFKIQNYINTTDPDSACISRLGKATVQGYNAQLAVDADTQVILAMRISSETVDANNLLPMIEELDKNGFRGSAKVLADSGYYGKKVMLLLKKMEIDAFIPPASLSKSKAVKPCPIAEEMRAKLTSEEGKAARKKRSSSVEPVNGNIKTGFGFTRFLTRGAKKVRGELALISMAHNIQKMLLRK